MVVLIEVMKKGLGIGDMKVAIEAEERDDAVGFRGSEGVEESGEDGEREGERKKKEDRKGQKMARMSIDDSLGFSDHSPKVHH